MEGETQVTEYPLEQALFWDFRYFNYDSRTRPLRDAEEEAQAYLAEREALERFILTHNNLYVKITKGARAGTIGRLNKPDLFRFIYGESHRGVFEDKDDHRLTVRGQIMRHGRSGEGCFYVDGAICCRNYDRYSLEVDGRGIVWSNTSKEGPQDPNKYYNRLSRDGNLEMPEACRRAGLVLLVGYQGPTIWQFTRGYKGKGPVRTIKDRFGEVVGIGSTIALARKKGGQILVGNVKRINDKGSIWIRNIGSETDYCEPSVSGDQILLLKDIERRMMTRKLSV